MKKLIFLAVAILGIVFSTQGQDRQAAQTMTGSGDTVVDAGTDSVTYLVLTNNNIAGSVQIVVTKTSGTVAGHATLWASNDKGNYVQLNTDTLTLTNVATQTKIWAIPATTGVIYLKYKVVVVGSGTMGASIRGYFVAIKPD